MIKTEIAVMGIDDLNEVMKIEEQQFSMLWTLEMFLHEIIKNNAVTLKCLESRIILGYMCWWLIEDETHLTNIAVKPDYENMGFGSLLVTYLFDWMQQNESYCCFLEVRKSNYKARSFYDKLGFSQLYTRKDYYVNPVEDAIILVKNLRSSLNEEL